MPAEFCGSARLMEDDSLPADNQRVFCFKPERAHRIFLVEGVPSRIRSLNETYYLNVALSALPDDRIFEIAVGTIEQVPWDNLDKLGTLLLANVARFTPDQADRITGFVRDGGNAVFALGDQIDPAAYNGALAQLLPATVGPVVGDANRRLETFFLGETEPGFAGFSANADALRRCRFFAFHDLQNPAPQSHILGRFNTGQPLLIEHIVGTGRVYLFASSVSAIWNDFPLQPTYLPFWRNFLAHLTPVSQLDTNVAARESLTAPATAADLARLKSAGFEIMPATDPQLTQELPGNSMPLAGWLAMLLVCAAAGEWAFSNHLSKEGAA
jgi:hypothetical protein